MNTLTRRIGVALTAALLATTAIAPMASAREFQGDHRNFHGESHGDSHRGGDNGAGLAIGLGIAAIAGIALLSNANQPAPVYQPAYPVPAYSQPVYAQPAYAPSMPSRAARRSTVQPPVSLPTACIITSSKGAVSRAGGNRLRLRASSGIIVLVMFAL